MVRVNFKYDGKIYSFEENNWAQLATRLPRLNNKQFTATEARKLYENSKKFIEIQYKNDNDDKYNRIGYIDTKKKMKPQLQDLGLKYNVNVAARIATTYQKGKDLTRDNLFSYVKKIVSVSPIEKLAANREELNISDQQIKLSGSFSFVLKVSINGSDDPEYNVIRTLTKLLEFDPVDPDQFELNKRLAINTFVSGFGNAAELKEIREIIYTGDILNNKPNLKFPFTKGADQNYYLRDLKPLDIKGIFNVDLFEYENPENKNCLINFLQNHYSKNKTIQKSLRIFSAKEEPTYDDLKKFVIDNKIKCKFFDINGYCIFEQSIKSTSKHACINAVIHNNHIYPISKSSKILNKLEKKIGKIDKENKNVVVEEIKQEHNNKLINIIKEGNMPTIISESHFIHNDIHHILNEDFTNSQKVYKMFSINRPPNKGNCFTFIDDLISIIEKNPVKSYFPYNHKEKGLGYSNKIDDINYNDIFAIDVNKAFSSALSSLKYLPTIDIRYNKIFKYEGQEIQEDLLYLVETDEPSVFFPANYSFIWGWYILRIKEIEELRNDKINYNIKEFITCNKNLNYYSYIIPRLFNESKNDEPLKDFIKLAVNVHIGKFQKIIGEKKMKSNLKKSNFCIMSNEHIDNIEKLNGEIPKMLKEKIDDNYSLCYEAIEQFEMYTHNNLPLSYAVIQNARLKIINKLIELNYNSDDVIQIKTDAIYLNNKDKKYSCKCDDSFGGWKEIKPTEKDIISFYYSPNDKISFYEPYITNKFSFCSNALAGGGKTYSIINNLLPSINDYVILSSFHLPLMEYRTKNIKSNTLSHYMYLNKIPEEQNIIIDEFGLMNTKEWDFVLQLLYKYEKNIYLYGDNKQLQPVNDKSINNFFLESHSNKYTTEWNNHRNDFKTNDYEEMIEKNNDIEYATKLIKKYCNSDIDDKETVFIAYRNENRKQINNIMMEKNNYVMNENEISVGVKLINKTNNLNIGGLNIYNKHQFIVIENNTDGVIIQDAENNKIQATRKEIIDNMDLAFCLTLYCVQGQTIPKIHFVDKDIDMLCKVPNALYTLISRVKI